MFLQVQTHNNGMSSQRQVVITQQVNN